jgi:ribosomal protein L37E
MAMLHNSQRFDPPDDDDWDDREDLGEDDSEDEAAETIRCSHCGAEIYEDAPQCPRCGWYATADTNPWSGRSVVWILLGLLGVAAGIAALSGFLRR